MMQWIIGYLLIGLSLAALAFITGAISSLARKTALEALEERDGEYTEKEILTCQAISECSLIITTTVLWGCSVVIFILAFLFGRRKESE